jgi:hypothetical protein
MAIRSGIEPLTTDSTGRRSTTELTDQTGTRAGNRTPVIGFGDRRSTTELHWQILVEMRGIEPRFAACKTAVLPLNDIPKIGWQGRIRTCGPPVNSRMHNRCASCQLVPTSNRAVRFLAAHSFADDARGAYAVIVFVGHIAALKADHGAKNDGSGSAELPARPG